jgi:hypothetical protein
LGSRSDSGAAPATVGKFERGESHWAVRVWEGATLRRKPLPSPETSLEWSKGSREAIDKTNGPYALIGAEAFALAPEDPKGVTRSRGV